MFQNSAPPKVSDAASLSSVDILGFSRLP